MDEYKGEINIKSNHIEECITKRECSTNRECEFIDSFVLSLFESFEEKDEKQMNSIITELLKIVKNSTKEQMLTIILHARTPDEKKAGTIYNHQ